MPAPACCLLAALVSSSAIVEAAAGVDGEVAVGRAPVQLLGPEENSITFTLVPGAALRRRSAASTLALSYTPRIFYRLPNALDISRPLVLHQVSMDSLVASSRSMAWASQAQVSVGELDYTSSGFVFDPGARGFRTPVVEIVRANGLTGFQLDLTRRLRWSAGLSAEYTKPIGEQPPIGQLPADVSPEDLPDISLGTVPESAQVSTESSLSYALNRTNRLAANGEVTYQWFPDRGRYLLLAPDIAWTSELSRQTSLALAAGFAYVMTLATADDSDEGNAIGGTGSIQLNSIVHRERNVRVATSFGASLDWFFDPVIGTSQPRAAADAGASIDIGRDWNISPNVAFYTILRDTDTGLGDAGVPGAEDSELEDAVFNFDSTQLRAELPFTYDVSRALTLNFGLRGALRGTSLTEPNFDLARRTEIWAFFGFTVSVSSGDDDANWLPL